MSTPLRVGVVGAGRVGAVLAARLRAPVDATGDASADPTTGPSIDFDVVAVAGASAASLGRAADLLPGVPVRKPSAVARACDLLLLTVPDDMLANVAKVLADSGAIREGQYVVHTSGRHGLSVLDPAADAGARVIALHPAMTFTGTAVDLDRLSGCVFGVTAARSERRVAERLVAALGGRMMPVGEEMRTLYHAGLAHGANHLVTLVSEAMEMLRAAGADDPAGTLRPLLTAALDNALAHGDAALTGPIVRGDAGTVAAHLSDLTANVPQALPSYVAMARATLDRAAADGRLLPLRAVKISALLDAALAESPAAQAQPFDPTRISGYGAPG